MPAKAEAKYIRMSPTKIRLVLDLIKGKTVEKANSILDNTAKRAAGPVRKVVNSAFSNLNQSRQEKILSKDVVISIARADSGPILHRYRAATMGRATPVKHRTACIKVELDEAAGKAAKPKTGKKAVKKTSSKKTGAKKTGAGKTKKSGEKA